MRKNINNWKVLNNTFPWFATFCIVAILYIGCRVNYWYFLLFIFIPFLVWERTINIFQLLLIIGVIFIFSLLIIFAWQYGIIPVIRQNMNNVVRTSIFNFLDASYSKEVASFIKLILFNVRSQETYIFYKQTVDLGIVWLLCISGFHISFLTHVITYIFKKKPHIGRYVNITFVMFYSYLLRFSYASIRILLKLFLQPIFFNFKIDKFDRIGIIGLIICFLNPCCFKDYGFLLSFLICIGSNYITKLELNNKIINRLLINILAFVITIPFVIQMNHKISLFTFINAFIFNNISGFIFLYFLIFSWMPFMSIIHNWIITGTYAIIGNISFSNIFIYSKSWDAYIICVFYICLFAILKIIYLIVYNNKI